MTLIWQIVRWFALWLSMRAWNAHIRWDDLDRYASHRIRRARRT